MKIFAIRDERDVRGRDAAHLIYYEKARRFYEKQGYRWNGERLGCRAGEQELTDLCYEKPLGE